MFLWRYPLKNCERPIILGGIIFIWLSKHFPKGNNFFNSDYDKVLWVTLFKTKI